MGGVKYVCSIDHNTLSHFEAVHYVSLSPVVTSVRYFEENGCIFLVCVASHNCYTLKKLAVQLVSDVQTPYGSISRPAAQILR